MDLERHAAGGACASHHTLGIRGDESDGVVVLDIRLRFVVGSFQPLFPLGAHLWNPHLLGPESVR